MREKVSYQPQGSGTFQAEYKMPSGKMDLLPWKTNNPSIPQYSRRSEQRRGSNLFEIKMSVGIISEFTAW